jgi:hypothetical protein
MNKYSGVNKNIVLFDQYAREIVDEMLLYNCITMAYKSLYIGGVKKEIFKYEVLYNEGHQKNIIEKLKKLKVTTFQTVEDIFKIEFPKSVAAQIDEKNKKIEQIFSEYNEYNKLKYFSLLINFLNLAFSSSGCFLTQSKTLLGNSFLGLILSQFSTACFRVPIMA